MKCREDGVLGTETDAKWDNLFITYTTFNKALTDAVIKVYLKVILFCVP